MFPDSDCLLMQALFKLTIKVVNGWKCAVPHESEADLEGWRVVLKIDDDREEEGGDEVGHRDNNWG